MEYEQTAVRRDSSSSSNSGSTSTQDPKERLRSSMTEETACSTETGKEYVQGAAGTNK